MFYSPKFQDVGCVEQEPLRVVATDQFYIACCERRTNLISVPILTNENTGLQRRRQKAIVNGPHPLHALGIAQSRSVAHQLISLL